MRIFFLQFFLLVLLMFLGVLFGMQQANEGILTMRGYEDPSYASPFKIRTLEEGDLQASFLGTGYTSHDFTEKKNELEQIEAFNIFSSTGKKISEFITQLSKDTIEVVFELFKKKKSAD